MNMIAVATTAIRLQVVQGNEQKALKQVITPQIARMNKLRLELTALVAAEQKVHDEMGSDYKHTAASYKNAMPHMTMETLVRLIAGIERSVQDREIALQGRALAPFLDSHGISRIFGDLVELGADPADTGYLYDMEAEDFAGLGLSAAEQGRFEDALGAQQKLRAQQDEQVGRGGQERHAGRERQEGDEGQDVQVGQKEQEEQGGEGEAEKQPTNAGAADSASEVPSMVGCNSCTFENEAGTAVCAVCGANVEAGGNGVAGANNAPGVGAPEADTPGQEHWICASCTFENTPGIAACAMCGAKHEAGDNKGGAAAAAAAVAWSCGACTFENESGCSQCGVCGAER